MECGKVDGLGAKVGWGVVGGRWGRIGGGVAGYGRTGYRSGAW